MPYIYVFDTHVCIEAETKEEADVLLEQAKATIETVPGASLAVFSAWGVQTADTGEEIRPVK